MAASAIESFKARRPYSATSFDFDEIRLNVFFRELEGKINHSFTTLGGQMIIHQREIGYGDNYSVLFETLVKAKAYLEEKHPEISVELMYNLAGARGRATILTRYASLADYERIDAEADADEKYAKLMEPIMSAQSDRPIDQFYRVIQ